MSGAFQQNAFQNDAFQVGTIFTATGALPGQTAVVTGSAARKTPGAPHVTSGALPGQTATVTGSAKRFVTHSATGILPGKVAIVTGSANHISLYPAESDVRAGVVYGPGGIYTGTYVAGGVQIFVFDD